MTIQVRAEGVLFGMTNPWPSQVEAVERLLEALPTEVQREQLLADLESDWCGGRGLCSRCGLVAASKTQSGTETCGRCWSVVKLDDPAASHWAKVAEAFLSNVDTYDWMTYLPACGLSRGEILVMIKAAAAVRDHSRQVLDDPFATERPVSFSKPGTLLVQAAQQDRRDAARAMDRG